MESEVDEVEESPEVLRDTPETPVEADVVRVHAGKALTFDEAYDIVRAARTRLIVVAGLPKSGKTTLIASLFHSFQKGPFAGFSFSKSATLLGFDERCHDARVSSRRDEATTERTKSGTTELLLHLQVCSAEGQKDDLLLVDMSGEHYDSARDSVEECGKLTFLRRADHFVLLLDGAKLSDLQLRQKAKTDALVLLRSCFDSGQLGAGCLVDVLVTKWDLVQQSQSADSANAFADGIANEINQRFGPRCRRLTFTKVAARPTSTILPVGWGMEDVFRRWIVDVPELMSAATRPVITQTHTEFDRFATAHGSQD